MLRQPAVAGYFYPQDAEVLRREIETYIPNRPKTRAYAVVVPHAGYVYSGHVAGQVYGSVVLPDRFVILCPNHTGQGSDFDLWPEGQWLTPLGAVQIDDDLGNELLRLCPRIKKDGRAHLREHSLEVQLPFLQSLKQSEFRFLALCVGQIRYEYLEELGRAIAQAIRSSPTDILIVASSDMTHYESQESAGQKDRLAIECMENMDPRALYDVIHRHNISMCGYLPVTAALIAARELGASKGTLIQYATSGDVSGDTKQVVGYAGVIVS